MNAMSEDNLSRGGAAHGGRRHQSNISDVISMNLSSEWHSSLRGLRWTFGENLMKNE